MILKNIRPFRGLVAKFIFGVLFLLLFENICSGGQWTMMFYMAADNELYSQALTDIEELQKISGQPDINIIVQLDSPSGAFRYRVLPQGISVLAGLGQSNSGSPEALADFGEWAVKNYPARKYLLVLWDHGDGWSKKAKYIGYDQQFNDFLNVAGGELREGLAKISATAGQPLDLIIFDACSMQMAEVLMELNGLCRYAVGSEALFPVDGMPYEGAWNGIDGNIPAESLAIRLVNSCNIFNDLGYQTTCSAVNISILSSAAQNLMSTIGQLKQLPVSTFINPSSISDSVLNFPPFASYDLPQALDFVGNRIPDPEKTLVLSASQQFRNSIMTQCITGNQNQPAQGLAVWYPTGKINFESGIEAYSNLNWPGLSGWDKLLYQLIFQQDSTAPVPQNVTLAQGTGGIWTLGWERGYDPSGIELYQIRHSQNMIINFNDPGGSADSSNWDKTGFSVIPKADGDTAYYSIGGQMTSKDAIPFDSSGNIGFTAKGYWGSIILESSSDTSIGWDTIGVWDCFGESREKYYSAKTKDTSSLVRFTWEPISGGYGVYIDNIKVCHPDSSKEVEIVKSSLPFYNLGNRVGAEGFYQVMSVDSLQNQSSWSDVRFYQPSNSIFNIWPNPFKGSVFLLFSSSSARLQEIKIFNILGQYVDRMSLRQKAIKGRMAEYLYCWKPKATIAGGVYIAKLDSDTGIRTIKMILIR